MRVTNSMIYGTAINNIHKNARYLNKLVTQIETGVKIQIPSDDPILSARTLRYRTILAETSQFLRNVDSGLTWMEVSEASLINITQDLLQDINVLIVGGANGDLTLEDRMAKIEEMRQHINQIGLEMNQTFMGRYVFSGYKTNQPPILTADNDNAYVITQQFNMRDMERIKSFQKDSAISMPVSHNANVLKLAYNNVDFNFNLADENGNVVAAPGLIGPPGIGNAPPLQYTVVTRSILDADAYTPPTTQDGTAENPFIVHYIAETSELVFCDAARDTFRDGTTVTYFKEGFKQGELNPEIYFDTVEVTGKILPAAELHLVSPPVANNGQFDFVVDVQGTENPGLYDITQNSATSPVIEINGVHFPLWEVNTQPSVNTGGDTWETVFEINRGGINVNVIQRVTIAGDTYDIQFEVVNHGTDPINFNLTNNLNIALDGPAGYGNLVFEGNLFDGMTARPNAEDFPGATLGIKITSDIRESSQMGIAGDSGFSTAWYNETGVPGVPMTFSTTVQVEQFERLVPGVVRKREDEWIKYETSSGVHTRINDHARDIYTHTMYSDLKRLIEFAESLTVSDPRALEAHFRSMQLQPPNEQLDVEEAVAEQLAKENSLINERLHDRFNNMIDLIHRHTLNAVSEHTRLGSRMAKFDMMYVRLEEDEMAYTELLSDTIDTDMISTIKRKESAETVFNFALRTIANTTQLSLADFINR